jgi:trigger factor
MQDLNVKLENVSEISKKIKVEIPYSTVKKEIDETLEKLNKTAVIKGYRRGKAPKEVVEKAYAAAIKEEVAEQLINKAYVQALKDNKLEPVGYPQITNVVFKDNEPFTFEAIVEIHPVFEVKDYKGLEVEAFPTEPTDEDVANIVNGFLESRVDMKTLDEQRPVMDGDWMDIDLEGFVDGARKDDLCIKAYACKLGDKNMLLEALSDGIKGMKVGNEKEISHQYPADYYAEDLRGKETKFKVKLNKLLERIVPVLTDELVKESSLGESKDKFLETVRENIKKRKEEARMSGIRRQLIDKLLEKHAFAVPATEVERKLPEIEQRALQNIFGYQAAKVPEKQKREVLDKHKTELRKACEDDVRLSYILEAVAAKESITPNAEEIGQEVEAAAKSMGLTTEKLKEKYGEKNIERAVVGTLTERKTFDYLSEQAKIIEKKAPKEK